MYRGIKRKRYIKYVESLFARGYGITVTEDGVTELLECTEKTVLWLTWDPDGFLFRFYDQFLTAYKLHRATRSVDECMPSTQGTFCC